LTGKLEMARRALRKADSNMDRMSREQWMTAASASAVSRLILSIDARRFSSLFCGKLNARGRDLPPAELISYC
jgi:hypothetical protein